MPSNNKSSVRTETIRLPFATVPNVEIQISCRQVMEKPSLEELRLVSTMLEALFQEVPFDAWEN